MDDKSIIQSLVHADKQLGLNREIYKQIFDRIEKKKDDVMDYKELMVALNSIGEYVSEEQAKKIVEEIDLDGNLEIDFDEFLKLISDRILDPDLKKYIHKAFQLFSDTKEGFITMEEAEQIYRMHSSNYSHHEITEMLSILPWEEDKTMNYEKFIEALFLEL